MKVLFLTLVDFNSFSTHSIYCDLLREFIRNGHEVYAISPTERRFRQKTHLEENGHILKLKTGNIQKTNLIEKGVSTLLIEPQFKAAIKKYFSNICFDIILYSTPPITLLSSIKYVKKRDNAKTYLMLKDIFPQNAVDLDIFQTTGLKSFIYKYFRNKEKNLYAVSDRIGCMSQANVDYILNHNPEVDPSKVEICPNAIEPQEYFLMYEERNNLRQKYGIPTDKKVFVYGGNLGKPQGIPFIIDCLRAEKDNRDIFFLIVGSGTEYNKLEEYISAEHPANVKLMNFIPKDDFDKMVAACDIGLIFLDYRFTIPNFPSRLLSYMQAGIPVLACTDKNTDIGQIITKAGFGWWCESNNINDFILKITEILHSELETMKRNELLYLKNNYLVNECYSIISMVVN